MKEAKPNQRNKKLPVMVFIHGGAFVALSANEYQPYILMNEDIVLIVIQYRLGIFGFLSTEDSVMPGNMGLKDQQLALKWVKENIESFGGDSNSITIFGESAGGASVHYQVLSPGSKGLFNRAIIQSGTALCPWASNKNHRKFAIETGQEFNCSIDFGTEKYRECMQNVNPYYLTIAASQTKVWGLSYYYVLPRVDGEFIDEAPEILMRKGKYNKVDIIQGITRDEGGLDFYFDYLEPNRKEKFNNNFEYYGPISLFLQNEENSVELARQVYQHYLHREDVNLSDDDWKEIMDINSDRLFRVAHDTVANFFAKDQNIKFYTYQFDHLANVSLATILPGSARRDVIAHSDDLKYFFYGGGVLKTKLESENDLKMGKIFLNLWINFAKTGNPTPPDSDFKWHTTTSNSFRYLSLTTSPVMKEDSFQKVKCKIIFFLIHYNIHYRIIC
ncbi:Venom carboxylesterase-6 [Armadillidium nasatum]|uniref:Carboxylic ester hydrolase n=1 Tax=Armadillidium nasatum TaxID=96803 RepID=A0A5N5SXZ9_9CRUS|nr:Venom carboxylesterase-6 [Armadillidium nasatum]